jgi:hypothetical protein
MTAVEYVKMMRTRIDIHSRSDIAARRRKEYDAVVDALAADRDRLLAAAKGFVDASCAGIANGQFAAMREAIAASETKNQEQPT